MQLLLNMFDRVTDVDMNVLTLLWIAGLCAGVVLTPIVAVHRLYYHPLAALKGPYLTRLSGWPNWYHAVIGDRHKWLHHLHETYGPVVRFTPNAVSFNTIDAVNTIYRSRGSKVFKSDWYQCVRDSAGGFESTFTTRNAERHRIKRGLLSRAFSDRALDDYNPKIHVMVRKWIDCLQYEALSTSSIVDIGVWTRFLIFDILGDVCFGKSFRLLDSNKKDRSVAVLVPKATRVWHTVGHHPMSRVLRYLLFKTRFGAILSRSSYKDNAAFRTFCVSTFRQRFAIEREQQVNPKLVGKDMFHHLLNGRDPETGEAYSPGDLACESVLLIVAGTHTTSTAISAILWYLANDPQTLSKLRKELSDSFTSAKDICHETLALLPYLRACINEGLRLSPPTPGHLPRTVLGEGLAVDGHWMPRGTTVGVSAYALHHNETYFGNSGCFIPERWMAKDQDRGMSAFIPFSVGPAGCVGKRLAYIQMSLAIAMFVWHFDFTIFDFPIEKEQDCTEYSMRDMYVGQGDGPYLSLRRVDSP